MADDLKMKVKLETDAAGLTRGYSAGIAATKGFESGVTGAFKRIGDESRKGIDKVKSAIGGLSTGQKVFAGLGIGVGLLATGLAASIAPAIQFESAFAGVRKTVDGTPQQLNAIRQGILDMSRAMPVAATDLADIAASAGQLGIQAPNILGFTDTIAKLGATTDLVDFEGAAQSLARFINITEAGQEDAGRLADVLVELGNNTATTESQILTFGSRLAAALNAAGAAPDEILALGAAFSSMGVEAEAGASALSTVFTKIADAAINGGKDLRIFAQTAGLTQQAFADLAKEDPTEAFVQFAEGLGRVATEGKSITPILEGLELGGLRTSRVLQLAAANTDLLRTALGLASEQFANGGAAQTEFNARLATTQAKLEILQNNIRALAIDVGSVALGGLADGLDAATAGAQKLGELLGPLASELVELFRNSAEAAALLFDTLGAPVLKVLAAGFLGVTAAATAALNIFNSFGPAGVIILGVLATLQLYPAALTAVRAAALAGAIQVGALGAVFQALGARAALAAAGTQLFQAALAAGPLIVVTVALASLGKALYDAGQSAKVAGENLRDGLNKAIEETDYSALEQEVSRAREQMERLDEIDRVSEGWGGGVDSWTTAFKSAVQVITPFTENTVVNARAEIEALNAELEESQADELATGLSRLAAQMGLSEDEAFALAAQMGLLESVIADGARSGLEFDRALDTTAAKMAALDESGLITNNSLNDFFAQVVEGAVGLDDMAEEVGLSTAALLHLGEISDNVNLEDLASDEVIDRFAAVEAVISEVEGVMRPLAESVGLTATEMLEQAGAVREAAGAFDEYEASIQAAISGLDAYNNISASIESKKEVLDETREAFDGTDEAIKANVDALKLYVSALAASGDVSGALQFQTDFVTALVDSAVQTGRNRDEVIDYITELGLIPPAVATALKLENEEALAKAREAYEAGEAWAVALFEAGFLADTGPALGEVELLNERSEAFQANGPYTAEVSADVEGAGDVGLLQEASEFFQANGPYTAEVEADTSSGESSLGALQEEAGLWELSTYSATLDADNEPATGSIGATRIDAEQYDLSNFEATLEADNAPALGTITATETDADAYAGDDYTAALTADNEPARSAVAAIVQVIKLWRLANYQAVLRADARPAVAAANVASAFATRFAVTPYTAVLRANAGQAVAEIYRAIGALAGFRSKTITLRTVRQGENGMVLDRFGSFAFENGGIAGMPPGAVLERPGSARIYPPAAVGRFFAEPQTGGEAFIPLGLGKRAQALQVYEQVGHILGRTAAAAFADGGIIRGRAALGQQTSSATPRGVGVSIVNQIDVHAAAGMDEGRLASMVGDVVADKMDLVARDLENALVG